jgi:ATP-dependent Clp protease adaptor protein ClpS
MADFLNNSLELPEIEEEILLSEELALGWSIVLYNDDVNTFEWVIECLIKYCRHEYLQAQQCAMIVHSNGKCKVKNGSYNELEPVCVALLDCGLSARIEI